MIHRIFLVGSLLALVGAGLLHTQTQAQDCRRVFAPTTFAYTAPTYVAPVYGHADTILYPRAIVVRARSEYVAGVGEEIRQEEFAKRIALEYFKLVEDAKLRGAPVPQPPLGVQGPNTPPVDVTPKENLKAPVGALTAKQVLDKNCVSCHKAGGKYPDLSDADKVSEIDRLRSVRDVSDGSMPKNKPPIGQEEYNVLVAWSKVKPKK